MKGGKKKKLPEVDYSGSLNRESQFSELLKGIATSPMDKYNLPFARTESPKGIIIDALFLYQPRVQTLLSEFGHVSIVILLQAWGLISRAEGWRIAAEELAELSRAARCKLETSQKILRKAVELGLIESDGESFTSSKMRKDVEKYQLKSEVGKRAMAARWHGSTNSSSDKPLLDIHGETVSFSSSSSSSYNSNSSLKDSSRETPSLDQPRKLEAEKPVAYLPQLDTPECREALRRWGEYLRSIKKPFGEFQRDALQFEYSTRPAELVRNINFSIASGYRSVYAAPQPKQNGVERPQARMSVAERNRAITRATLEQVLREEKDEHDA